MPLTERKPNRLKNFDYSSNGAYFITICTQDRINLFGDVLVGADSISAQMRLNLAGELIETVWLKTISEYESIQSDKYVIMPNHFHCILTVSRADMESAPTISTVIQAFKRHTTIKYISGVKSGIYPSFNKRIWQRNFHDHIIRDEPEYRRIQQYIDENPAKWQEDPYCIRG